VNKDVSEKLISRIPKHIVAVAESGLKSGDEVRRLKEAGYRAFLVGEHAMSAPDPGAALADLLREASA
jgi:indole-3-glycerol phosphate synthase